MIKYYHNYSVYFTVAVGIGNLPVVSLDKAWHWL